MYQLTEYRDFKSKVSNVQSEQNKNRIKNQIELMRQLNIMRLKLVFNRNFECLNYALKRYVKKSCSHIILTHK